MRFIPIALLGLLLLVPAVVANAQPYDVPPTWGGGLRDELGKKGVVFDVDLLLTPQSVMTGGHETGSEFWGNADYTVNIDTGKLGLWPGGFLKVSQGEFAGNYRSQFLNTGLVIPASMDLVPISAFGGGIIVLPVESVLMSVLVLNPSGTPTDNDLSDAFEDGVALVGGMWSNQTRLNLSQDPSNISRMLLTERFPALADPGRRLERFFERFFPQLLTPVKPARKADSTWAIYYGFDQ